MQPCDKSQYRPAIVLFKWYSYVRVSMCIVMGWRMMLNIYLVTH